MSKKTSCKCGDTFFRATGGVGANSVPTHIKYIVGKIIEPTVQPSHMHNHVEISLAFWILCTFSPIRGSDAIKKWQKIHDNEKIVGLISEN